MKFDPPRLTQGGLSGAVFVVTHGKIRTEEKGVELIEATTKYDVTTQFDVLAIERGRQADPERYDEWSRYRVALYEIIANPRAADTIAHRALAGRPPTHTPR